MKRTLLLLFCLGYSGVAQTLPCTSVHPAAVAWWKAEGDSKDAIGTNHGTGNPAYVTGQVGQAFGFNGVNQQVVVPNSASLSPTNLTIEAWVKALAGTSDVLSIVTKESDLGILHYALDQISVSGRHAFAGLMGFSPGLIQVTTTTPIELGKWYHLAMTYDGNALKLYLNGVLESISPYRARVRTGQQPLYIGGERGDWLFNGLIDEITLYKEPLSAEQIASIFAAGQAGKCDGPFIVSHPRSQVGFWGKEVTFSVTADGDAPLTYYWRKDGVSIQASNLPSLTLTNLQMTDAGLYSVIVSNRTGTALSKAATLTMNPAGVSSALYTGITIDGVVGFTYGIQVSTNLNDSSGWRGLANVTLGAPQQLWIDLKPAVESQRFYRVVPGPIPVQ